MKTDELIALLEYIRKIDSDHIDRLLTDHLEPVQEMLEDIIYRLDKIQETLSPGSSGNFFIDDISE